MIPSEKVIVAIDETNPEKVQKLLKDISPYNVWVKIGMELFYAEGPGIVRSASEQGLRIFLDLKLHDIPTTVEKSLRVLRELPIGMINIHAAGGAEMMKRAAGAVKEKNEAPLLIAVTQLTSTTEEQMRAEQKIPSTLVESVSHYAKLAKDSGCDGVVSSAQETQAIKLICGSRFLTVTPGIRPVGSDVNDQKRITTPQDALNTGSDFMVIGRPITQAPSPSEALYRILKGN